MTESNRFAPPRSEVADTATVGAANGRPLERPTAVKLAFGALVFSLVLGLLNYFTHAVQGSAAVVSITLAALFGLALAIRAGMNWARILLLVFFLLGLPSFLAAPTFIKLYGLSFLVVFTFQTLLQGAALWFVFRKPGSLWFKPSNR